MPLIHHPRTTLISEIPLPPYPELVAHDAHRHRIQPSYQRGIQPGKQRNKRRESGIYDNLEGPVPRLERALD